MAKWIIKFMSKSLYFTQNCYNMNQPNAQICLQLQ